MPGMDGLDAQVDPADSADHAVLPVDVGVTHEPPIVDDTNSDIIDTDTSDGK
jgi:hypothetical protein